MVFKYPRVQYPYRTCVVRTLNEMENPERFQPRDGDSLNDKAPRPDNEEEHDEEPSTSPDTATVAELEYVYITGLKLFLVLIAATLACFLMLLDSAIIATVSNNKSSSSFTSSTDILK